MRKKYFRGKCAVITGAASGIGKQFAISLAKIGTNLVISDINMERLEEVKKITETNGVKVLAISCDVTKRLQLENLAKTAINEFNDIHFIFSNAGIAVGGSFENIDFSQWKRIININLWGMIYTIKAFIAKLVEQGFGHVIVTSSIAGTIGIGGLIPYNTTKFANAGFCEALYGEYHNKGINVSIVSPFPLKTNLIETVGIGIPQDIIESLDANVAQMAIEAGKKVYWEKFTKKKIVSEGFGGGFTVERAIKLYLKKIKKKKLYIFERRYGKLTQFTKGISTHLYKKILRFFGKRHVELLDEVFTIVKDMQNKEN
ncbi:MAG: SDR family NAD(P)-dependent oxidoreductase [Promethearchaeota archaeon]